MAAEKRLEVRLAPSYRNFLQVSDGWQDIGDVGLFPVGDIGWFADLEADLMEVWSEAEVFVEYLPMLKRSLLIGDDDGGSGCYWLLHADSMGKNRE